MKLTESKLKKMIRETMERQPLPHLEKITDLFANSLEGAKQAASLVDALEEYPLRKEPVFRESDYIIVIGLRFKSLSDAEEFYDALHPKLQEPTSAKLHVFGQSASVNIVYPNMDNSLHKYLYGSE